MSADKSKLVIDSSGKIVDYEKVLTTTQTVIAITNLRIDIQNFFRYIPITEYEPIKKKRGRRKRIQPPVFVNKLESGSIISMQYGNMIKGTSSKKKKSKKTFDVYNTEKKPDDFFRHSVSCVMMLENNKEINIKIPMNGKLQMTGCKSEEHSIQAVIKLYKMMMEVEKWTNERIFTLDGSHLSVIYNIVMQNKDFEIGFRINRQNLDRFINTKTSFFSIFEASTSTGINIKIENKNIQNRPLLKLECINDDYKLKHISYDDYYSLLSDKEKDQEKKKKYLTFFVFSSGSIIMSGRDTNMKELFYEVVNILLKNREEFEEKAYDRKIKVKKIRRSKIEIDYEN